MSTLNLDVVASLGTACETVIIEFEGWVKDGAAHFCPACQVQRGKAA
jgi:hypothetical protein